MNEHAEPSLEEDYNVDARDFQQLSKMLKERDPNAKSGFGLTLQVSSENLGEWNKLFAEYGFSTQIANVTVVKALKFSVNRLEGKIEITDNNEYRDLAAAFLPLCERMLFETDYSYDLKDQEEAMNMFIREYKGRANRSSIFEFKLPTKSTTMTSLQESYNKTISGESANIDELLIGSAQEFILRYRIENGKITSIQSSNELVRSLQSRFLYLILNAWMLTANY